MYIRSAHAALCALTFATLSATVAAAPVDLSTSPVSTAGGAKPNLMVIFDDSGSMLYDFLPDGVGREADMTSVFIRYCKFRYVAADSGKPHRYCLPGDPPYYAAEVNQVYYNPNSVYSVPVNGDRSMRPQQNAANTSNWTKVQRNVYLAPTDLTDLTKYPEIVYCKAVGSDVMDTTQCKQNGVGGIGYRYPDNTKGSLQVNPPQHYYIYGYQTGVYAQLMPGTYPYAKKRDGNPHFYTIKPIEYCKDADLIDCTLSGVPVAGYATPAPVRWCAASEDSVSTGAVTGLASGKPRCQSRYIVNEFMHPRYGDFVREDIVPTTSTYTRSAARTDCAAAPTCTYAEEMTNFANWFVYYRTRVNMMKTALGQAFDGVDSTLRMGYMTINTGGVASVSSSYQPIREFNAAQRTAWYNRFYGTYVGADTPLRQALARAGRHFAGKKDGGMEDPVQASCQANYTLLTTDGYWTSDGVATTPTGAVIGNVDNVDSAAAYSTRAEGVYDGGLAKSSGTLADVALYYYANDLRSSALGNRLNSAGVDVSADNVPANGKDNAPHQHMTTFTLGIVSGLMNYRTDYETAAGDFNKIKTAQSGACTWTSGTCNWPEPTAEQPTALDDLWHAAVNGRGQFYLATEKEALKAGIADMLSRIGAKSGSEGSVALSSVTPTPADNAVFLASYRTNQWVGELSRTSIDVDTAEINPVPVWNASVLLASKATKTSDSRNIFTSMRSGGKVEFKYSALDSADANLFKSRCSTFVQCGGLSAAERALADDGERLVNYLRGQSQDEGRVFRARKGVLGDIVSSSPLYIKPPERTFTETVPKPYASFKMERAGRTKVVTVGSNDGFLHGFDAGSGQELWAYVPRAVLPKMAKLADLDYSGNHEYFVDGNQAEMDIVGGGAWRTLLVTGLGGGGKGWSALDVTDPANPEPLWEFCADAALCDNADADLGYSYGKPLIVKRATDGKWIVVVASGYNNANGGGYFYMLDAYTGNVLKKIATGEGSLSTPAGLARLSAWVDSPDVSFTADAVYGGDLLGNVWRLDLSTPAYSLTRLAQLKNGGKPQPITTAPELTTLTGDRLVIIGTGRYLGVSDRFDPATLTPARNESFVQSLYAFKDKQSDLGVLSGRADMVKGTLSRVDTDGRLVTVPDISWGTSSGWYVDFALGGADAGERIVRDVVLDSGRVEFFTIVPQNDLCLGTGLTYAYSLDFKTGRLAPSSLTLNGAGVAGKLVKKEVLVALDPTAIKGQTVGLGRTADGSFVTIPFGGRPLTASGAPVTWRELTE